MPILTWSRKVALCAAGVIALLATGIGTIPDTQANTSSQNGAQAPSSAIAALQQRRAQLIAELAAMQPNLSAAGGAVNSAEGMFNAQQQKVLNERNQLAKLNATLLSLSSELNSNNATAAQDKAQLAAITRATYETSGNDQVLAAVLSAQSFNQAIDELKAANQVSQQVLALVERLAASNHAIVAEQTSIRSDAASAETLEGQLAAQSDRLITILENRNTLFAGLTGPRVKSPRKSRTSTIRSHISKPVLTSDPVRVATTSPTASARTTSQRGGAYRGSVMRAAGTSRRGRWDTRKAGRPWQVRSSCSGRVWTV
jgi:peptidoglycan hydrolase CwlO-like protein